MPIGRDGVRPQARRQRWRRAHYMRIKYYPSKDALAVIQDRIGPGLHGTLTAVIDALLLAAAGELPE